MAVEIGRNLPNLKITVGNDSPSTEEGEILENDSISLGTNNDNTSEQIQDVQIVRKFVSPLEKFRVYENKGGAFITGLDLSSEVVNKKLADRAARFGLEDRPKNPITDAEIMTLYKSLNIDSGHNKCKNIRLDALHVRGVEEMSTSDVISYFKEYGPASVEWINDFCCNVVWLDEAGAARALLGLSRVLAVKKKSHISSGSDHLNKDVISSNENVVSDKVGEEEVIFMSDISSDDEDEDDKLVAFKHEKGGNPTHSGSENSMEVDHEPHEDEKEVKDSTVDVPVPPGHWRLGIPHTKAKAILLRFATKDDRKLPGAEKRSHYYQKYGNPNYGGLRGLISQTRKRKFNATKQRQVVEQLSAKGNPICLKTSDKEHSAKEIRRLRMRMHADDEEEKVKMRNAKKQRTVENNSRQRSVHERLGRNSFRQLRVPDEYERNEELTSVMKPFNMKSTISRPSSSKSNQSRYDVWTRLAKSMAQESELFESNYEPLSQGENERNDLRRRLQLSSHDHKKTRTEEGDLRSKLEKLRKHDKVMKHRSPLLIELDS